MYVCIFILRTYFVVIMPNNVNTEWILGGEMLLGGYPRSSPPV